MEETQPTIPQENLNVGFPGAAQQPPAPPKKNWKWLIVLILFLIVIAGVTFFVFKSSRSSSTLEESPTPVTSLTNLATPEPTATPGASPSTTDKSQVKIQILNGTGVAGQAGLLSDDLKSLGYTNITTGNASEQNMTDTQVTFSSTLGSDIVTEITTKLKGVFTNVITNNASLSNFDVQITTGQRKGETAPTNTSSPQATASPSATPAQ